MRLHQRTATGPTEKMTGGMWGYGMVATNPHVTTVRSQRAYGGRGHRRGGDGLHVVLLEHRVERRKVLGLARAPGAERRRQLIARGEVGGTLRFVRRHVGDVERSKEAVHGAVDGHERGWR